MDPDAVRTAETLNHYNVAPPLERPQHLERLEHLEHLHYYHLHPHRENPTHSRDRSLRPSMPRSLKDSYSVERLEPYRDNPDDTRWRDSTTATESGSYSGEEDYPAGGSMDKDFESSSYGRVYYQPSRQHPNGLVQFVRNEWRNHPQYSPQYSRTSERSDFEKPLQWTEFLKTKLFRRFMLAYILTVAALWMGWSWWLAPMYEDYSAYDGSLRARMRSTKAIFGLNMRPTFSDMIQIKHLDANLLPGGYEKDRRLIIVGDVHGCRDELADLLSTLSFNATKDHLVLAGDLVSKGPFSPDVVTMAQSLNASCVRGNHEDRVLLAYRDLAAHPSAKLDPTTFASSLKKGNRPNKQRPVLSSSLSSADTAPATPDQALAASFSPEQIAYLTSCPLILSTPVLPHVKHPITIVHAGLVPGVPLDRQDPSAIMQMRSMDLLTHVPSRDPPTALNPQNGKGTVPWTKMWNRWQPMIPKKERNMVVYGHDSRKEVVKEDWSIGLDTGCWKGGRLSALVVEEGWNGKIKMRIESVKCRDWRPREMDALGRN